MAGRDFLGSRGWQNVTIGAPSPPCGHVDPLGHRVTQPQLDGLWPSSHITGRFEDGDKEALGKHLAVVGVLSTRLEPARKAKGRALGIAREQGQYFSPGPPHPRPSHFASSVSGGLQEPPSTDTTTTLPGVW